MLGLMAKSTKVTGLMENNMVQASFTGFCPAAAVFKRMGLQPGKAFD